MPRSPQGEAEKALEKSKWTFLYALQLSHWVPVTNPMRSVLLFSHFSEEKTEAGRGNSHRKLEQRPWNTAGVSWQEGSGASLTGVVPKGECGVGRVALKRAWGRVWIFF